MSDDSDPDFMRAWTTDAHGNRVLVGLSEQETGEYLAYQRDRAERRRGGRAADSKARGRWLQLHEKHERARLAVIGAEVELRHKPTIN